MQRYIQRGPMYAVALSVGKLVAISKDRYSNMLISGEGWFV